MTTLHKTIAYSKSWKRTFLGGLISGSVLAFILIFLEPFDTSESDISNKKIKLAGYIFCVLAPIIMVHIVENYIYNRQKHRWFLWNELLIIFWLSILIITSCYFYNIYIVNNLDTVSVDGWYFFFLYYGLPFLPILIPVLLYVRSKLGVIKVPALQEHQGVPLTIYGDNKTEKLVITSTDFIYAQAQQNYVLIFYKENDDIVQKMMRNTLTKLASQIPNAWQVHRSYLVNLDFFKSVRGNSRKRFMSFTVPLEDIPISQKYYEALQKRLSVSSQ